MSSSPRPGRKSPPRRSARAQRLGRGVAALRPSRCSSAARSWPRPHRQRGQRRRSRRRGRCRNARSARPSAPSRPRSRAATPARPSGSPGTGMVQTCSGHPAHSGKAAQPVAQPRGERRLVGRAVDAGPGHQLQRPIHHHGRRRHAHPLPPPSPGRQRRSGYCPAAGVPPPHASWEGSPRAMSNVAVVGAQWGDEGKGKIVDWLTRARRRRGPLPGRPQCRPHAGHRRHHLQAVAPALGRGAPGQALA